MAIAQAVTCDVCQKVKQITNHWWMVSDTEDDFLMLPWDEMKKPHLHSHICGQECGSKFLSKWMQLRMDEAAEAAKEASA